MNWIYLKVTLRWIWLLCTIVLLCLCLYIYDGTAATHDVELLLIYGIMLLSFPSSQLLALAFACTSNTLELLNYKVNIPMGYVTIFVEWLAFFSIGYLQWFILLPWLFHKWGERKRG